MTYNLSEVIVPTKPSAELSKEEKEKRQKVIDIIRDITLLEFDLDLLRTLYCCSLEQNFESEEEWLKVNQEHKEIVEAYVAEIDKKELELKEFRESFK